MSSDDPALDIVYKLVDYQGVPRAKLSEKKGTLPGTKQVFRSQGPESDVLALRSERLPGRTLLSPAWDGRVLPAFEPGAVRDRVESELAAVPPDWRTPPYPESPPMPEINEELVDLADRLAQREHGGAP